MSVETVEIPVNELLIMADLITSVELGPDADPELQNKLTEAIQIANKYTEAGPATSPDQGMAAPA